jgi:hypothetical protein
VQTIFVFSISEATNKSSDVNETFPVMSLIPYYAETGRSQSPNCLTLQITLMYEDFPKTKREKSSHYNTET